MNKLGFLNYVVGTELKNTTMECTKIIQHSANYERYQVTANPINSNKFTDFDLKKVKRLT